MGNIENFMNLNELERCIREGYVSRRKHPEADLYVLNYTHKTQYEKIWTNETMWSRGMIVDSDGDIVANCLKRFFNYEEHLAAGKPIPNEMPVVTTKYDGWYGSLYWYDDQPWIATRGSFTSPGAQWATAWIRQQWGACSPRTQGVLCDPALTHLFEIIAPCTRIVVQYPFEGLVHLAALRRETSVDVPVVVPDLRQADKVDAGDYATLRQMEAENAEGFVCHFPSNGLRLKIVLAQYRELHALYTRTSAHTIWKHLYDGQPWWNLVDDGMPRDLQQWTRETRGKLEDAKDILEKDVDCIYHTILGTLPATWGKDKTARDKAIGMALMQHPLRKFLLLYHKYQDALWKEVEPQGSATFRAEGDEDL